jgi:hypothetical protein
MLPAEPQSPTPLFPKMKMKYMMILAAALFAVGLPQADAAPKKSKKAKAAKKAAAGEFNFDIVSDAEVQADREEKKAKKQAEEAEQARLDARTFAEKRESNAIQKEETKYYMENLQKTHKILKKVVDSKSALKSVPALEKIYGKVVDEEAAAGTVTALGTVKVFEEEEEKLDVHIAFRAIVAARNANVNRELSRISKLKIDCPRFDAVIKNMIDKQNAAN